MGARRFGQCFDPSDIMENAGILDVFPIFHTARLGHKIRRSPQLPPKRCCLSILLPLEKRGFAVKYNSSRKRMRTDKKIMDNR